MLWALLATFAQLLIVLKIGRGLYLLWLAFKAGKSALRRTEVSDFKASDEREAYGRLFRQGILMHISNPEVIFYLGGLYVVCTEAGWVASTLPIIICSCAVIGVFVFDGYALLFSTAMMGAFYRRIRRGLDALLACCFALAGLKLVFSRS